MGKTELKEPNGDEAFMTTKQWRAFMDYFFEDQEDPVNQSSAMKSTVSCLQIKLFARISESNYNNYNYTK